MGYNCRCLEDIHGVFSSVPGLTGEWHCDQHEDPHKYPEMKECGNFSHADFVRRELTELLNTMAREIFRTHRSALETNDMEWFCRKFLDYLQNHAFIQVEAGLDHPLNQKILNLNNQDQLALITRMALDIGTAVRSAVISDDRIMNVQAIMYSLITPGLAAELQDRCRMGGSQFPNFVVAERRADLLIGQELTSYFGCHNPGDGLRALARDRFNRSGRTMAKPLARDPAGVWKFHSPLAAEHIPDIPVLARELKAALTRCQKKNLRAKQKRRHLAKGSPPPPLSKKM